MSYPNRNDPLKPCIRRGGWLAQAIVVTRCRLHALRGNCLIHPRAGLVSQLTKVNGRRGVLGRPTMRRSNLLVERHPTAAEREAIHQHVFERRLSLYRQAVDHVERHCDDLVAGNLERWASLNPTTDRSLRNAVLSRLRLFYGRRIAEDAARAEFDAIVDAALAQSPEVFLLPDGSVNVPDWGTGSRCIARP